MQLEKIITFGIDLEKIKSTIRNVVASVLQANKTLFSRNSTKFSDEYLSRKEAAKFLKISVTTLWRLDRKKHTSCYTFLW